MQAKAIASRVEAITTSSKKLLVTKAFGLEAIASRLEAIASRVEAIITSSKTLLLVAKAFGLQAIASRLKAIASRVEAIPHLPLRSGWMCLPFFRQA